MSQSDCVYRPPGTAQASYPFYIHEQSAENLVRWWCNKDTIGPPPPSADLRRLSDALWEGPGAALIPGLIDEGRSDQSNAAILCRLAAALGTIRPQTSTGEKVRFLVDDGAGWTRVQPFHSDGADGLALYYLHPAVEGGHLRITSAKRAHEALRQSDYASFALLHKRWYFWRKGRPGPSAFRRPIFGCTENEIRCFFLPGTLAQTPAALGTTYSERQRRALHSLVVVLEEGPSLHLAPDRGDLILVNNHTVLHARTAYLDAVCSPRLLAKVWFDRSYRPT